MIEIAQDETFVVVTVTASWESGASKFPLRFNCGTEWAARLLTWSMTQVMWSALTKAREDAYADGWRDAKAKKSAKQTLFRGNW